MPWIKFWNDYWTNDLRVVGLEDGKDLLPELFFMKLYLLAGRCNARGKLIGNNGYVLSKQDIYELLMGSYNKHVDIEELFEVYEARKLIHTDEETGALVVTDFADQQVDWRSKKEKDKIRKQKQREREKE